MSSLKTTCQSGKLLPLTRTPALTTVWTPPAFCSTRFHAGAGASAPYTYGWQDEVDPEWYSCVPPEWDSTACQSLTFSPALQCPHGWTVDASKTVLGPDRVSITFGTCCMSGFTAALYWDGEKCFAPVVNFPLVVLATSSTRYIAPLASSVSTATIEKGTIDHRGLVIGWQSSDLPTSSHPNLTGPLSPPTATKTTGAAPPSSSPVGNTDKEGGLSSGAVAGIAIGAAAVVSLVVAGIFLMWRRRRKPAEGHLPGSELDPGASTNMRPVSELPSPPIVYGEIKPVPAYQPVESYELGSGQMGGPDGVYEMPGR